MLAATNDATPIYQRTQVKLLYFNLVMLGL